ncbi:hypothetical protein SAMN04490356_0138 [Streptomyces melanosporofaciens]|uniref:Uncharacterized protein n=1 Tax=Streptomyces melanosporofaciens TaxID=67327 RepID=A0A1H4I9J7_STRMJ|nr:hypothetical protein SAMN04490356_0138 [Streptomyces melanosporofaciens]
MARGGAMEWGMARGPRGGRLRVVVSVGILVALAGCSGASDDSDKESPEEAATARKSPATASRSPSPSPSPTPSADSIAQACGDTQFDADDVLPWDPEAPAYTGGGTHSVTLFKGGPDFDESGTESDAEADDEPKLPDKWASSSDPELIVCEFLAKESVGAQLITCEYEELGGDGSVSTRVPVYSAGYSYRVLEAKTGRLVDTFNLSGSVSGWDSCPVEQSDIASSEAAYQHVSSRDLTKRLRSLVEGPTGD